MQVIRTVRRYGRIGAWVNKIGLRNPGIDWLAHRVRAGKIDPADKILSIHGFTEADWWKLLDAAAEIRPLAVELNMSCPNVGHIDWPLDLFRRAAGNGTAVVVKLPPVNYHDIFRQAVDAGLRVFHCCNTLPVPAGGLSGQPLKPVALQCIRAILDQSSAPLRSELRIIGGGGIVCPADIDLYADAGAHHVAVATKVFHPLYLFTHAPLRPLIDHARRRLGAAL
jgi:dihydroorotate dehydrogenase